MTRRAPLCLVLSVGLWLTIDMHATQTSSTAATRRRMSFHNRLLLNRAAVSGLRTLEVMLAVSRDGLMAASALVERLGGRVRRTEPAVGYMRVEIPIEKILDLTASPDIDAYQISSLSKANWYRDGPPQLNAEGQRRFEVTAPGSGTAATSSTDLPRLSPEAARDPGFTADEDAGVGEWLRRHPTFDGRGVTIALVENGLPSWGDATFGTAKTLDGRDVPKLAGILNAIPPDAPDETRVALTFDVEALTTWVRISARTYIVPRRGRYRFGLYTLPAGDNLIHQFGVLEDVTTQQVWVDTNGDASFQDEPPISDVNERFDVRTLKLRHPRQMDLRFVMALGRSPEIVHIYPAVGSHQSMTFSVAAGSRTREGLASGVAPNARVLFVRSHTSQYDLASIIEGFLEAAKRPVDVLSASVGINLVPDTATDFSGLIFQRLLDEFEKPIVNAAGNLQSFLGSVTSLSGGFSAGGSLGPASFAALYGNGKLDRLAVNPIGAAGPSIDGAIKPDFLTPMLRIAADLPDNAPSDGLPALRPTSQLPPGYQVSCCTSASSPYAAGVVALLMSAAKQAHVPYSLASLGRALRIGARYLPDFPSFQQGNGVLDVNAAWRELALDVDVTRIVASATVVHPLAEYAAQGTTGQGIFEFDGWTAGMSGRRELQLRRESGRPEPVTYGLSWTGNDGTFATMPSVTLPLDATVTLPVTIAISSFGAHGAILNLHDPATDAIVFRTQATVVASNRIDASTGSVRMTGFVSLMHTNSHYVQVRSEVGGLSIDLEVIRGTIRVGILPSHSLFPNYYWHLYPNVARLYTKGRYKIVLPNPAAGTWTIEVLNDSALHSADPDVASSGAAEYAITARLLQASLLSVPIDGKSVRVDLRNLGSELREPVIDASLGILRTHRTAFLPTGLPNTFDITVPEGAGTLALQLRSTVANDSRMELYLYDCTTGECFSDSLAFPAAPSQTLVVRQPKPGRWVAAVNAAPFPNGPGEFVLDEIVTIGQPHRFPIVTRPRAIGARWSETLDIGALVPLQRHSARALFLELIDLASERDETERPWDSRPSATKLRDRPVAAGTAVYRFE